MEAKGLTMFIKKLLHKLGAHDMHLAISNVCTVYRYYYSSKKGHDMTGKSELYVCKYCDYTRAFLYDSNGDAFEKLPEAVFTELQIQLAISKIHSK